MQLNDNQFEVYTSNHKEPAENNNVGTGRIFAAFIFDFLKVFIIAVAIIVPIRWFLFQPFVVTGDSMSPNFRDGDYLIIDEISYRFRDPERGEVVVMRFPHDPSQFFIKRIVGLPGERVIINSGLVEVISDSTQNQEVLVESYLPVHLSTPGNLDLFLGDGEYFVLGDNRLSSSDSRVWGPLDRNFVVGRALVRAFPLSAFKIFTIPEYNLTTAY